MKAVVLLNERSGACVAGASTTNAATIKRALESAGVEADVRCVPGKSLAAEAKEAASRGGVAVVAGGGDGTISAVAGALAGGDTPLGVIAAGTLNHFAKDLRLPLGLAEAVKSIAGGNTARVDVGVVNGRVFINNASLGVYARALIERDASRDRWGLGKWPAMALAALRVFWRSPLLAVRVETRDGATTRKTPLVFVGNNRYRLDGFQAGSRDRLDGGELSLYVATASTRWAMLKLIMRAAVGRLEQSRDLESSCAPSVWVETRRHRHMAIDGEVLQMEPPYHFRIWPGALRVIVSPE